MEDVTKHVKKEEFDPAGRGTVTITGNFFCVVTAEVMQDKAISDSEKLLYGFITSLCHNRGFCWAPNSVFEKQFGKSKRTVQDWLQNLKQHDYIMIEYLVDEKTGELLERRIYPLMNVELIRKLARNSKIKPGGEADN